MAQKWFMIEPDFVIDTDEVLSFRLEKQVSEERFAQAKIVFHMKTNNVIFKYFRTNEDAEKAFTSLWDFL